MRYAGLCGMLLWWACQQHLLLYYQIHVLLITGSVKLDSPKLINHYDTFWFWWIFMMSKLLCIYTIWFLSNTFFSTVHEQPCYDGQARHYDPVESFLPTTNTSIVGGFVEVCYQGQWSSICLSDFSNTDASHLSQLACKTIYGSSGTFTMIFVVAKLKWNVL